MKKEDLVPRYEFMDNFIRIHNRLSLNDIEAANLLQDMRDTILYQMEEIRQQRSEIIYVKHKNAWKQYDRPIDQYDYLARSYVDKPDRTDTMGC